MKLVTLIVLFVLLAAGVGAMVLTDRSATGSIAARVSDTPCLHSGPALAHVGLTPKALLAAGLSAESCQSVLAKAVSATTERANLTNAEAALASTMRTQQPILNQKPSGQSTEQVRAARAAATSQINTAKAAVTTAANALRAAALDGLATETVAKLDALRDPQVLELASSSGIIAADAKQAVAVKVALREEARASRLGTTVPESAATLLATVRTSTTTSNATAIANSSATVEAQFRQAN